MPFGRFGRFGDHRRRYSWLIAALSPQGRRAPAGASCSPPRARWRKLPLISPRAAALLPGRGVIARRLRDTAAGTPRVFLNMSSGAFDQEDPEPDACALFEKFWAGLLETQWADGQRQCALKSGLRSVRRRAKLVEACSQGNLAHRHSR